MMIFARLSLWVPVIAVVTSLLFIGAGKSVNADDSERANEGLPTIAGAFAERPEARALWEVFKTRFVAPDGRVIDDGNGGISHSEGQGYGMLLAVAADDPGSFARIWAWTRMNLAIRDDDLAAWRWRPNASPHVEDPNNASDADLLIAWALAEAGAHWGHIDYTDDARKIARTVHDKLVADGPHGRVLMPASAGFDGDARPDGPVVNLSYWVFPALVRLQALLPDQDWSDVVASGLGLIEAARFGPADLPADWVSLAKGAPAPAEGFTKTFGYDAVRIPLYLAWSGLGKRQLLAPFMTRWGEGEVPRPTVVDLRTGQSLSALSEPGYRSVASLVRCAMEGQRFPEALRAPDTELYYPTTLRLLTFAALFQRFPECW